MPEQNAELGAGLEAWVAARVVLIQCPDNPANPIGVLSPDIDFADRLRQQHPTLRSVEGPFINGLIAMTWDHDGRSDPELVAASAQAVAEAIPGYPTTQEADRG